MRHAPGKLPGMKILRGPRQVIGKAPEGWLADDVSRKSSHYCYKRAITSPFVGFATREKKRASIELRLS